MMRRPLCFLLAVGGCLCPGRPAGAVVQLTGLSFAPKSGVEIRITGYFDNLPKAGCVPLRIEVRNDSTRRRTWTFTFRSQSGYRSDNHHEYIWSASVNAATERGFDILVPLAAVGSARHGYPSMTVSVEGFGVGSSVAHYAGNYKYSGKTHTPFVGISATLSVESLGPLESELEDRGYEFTGCALDPAWLSPDWRAYLGFGSVWLTEQDWLTCRPAVRAGLLDWVAQGGRLCFCTDAGPGDARLTAAGLPPGSAPERPHGLGKVYWVQWTGSPLSAPDAASLILRDEGVDHARQITEGYASAWVLRGPIGSADLSAPLIILAMLSFAFVVGPVNLVLLAGRTRRHRLFVTTPAISLVASVLLVGIILIQDGVGGHGARVGLTYLLPDSRQAMIVQEQVSRTGLLTASRFSLPENRYASLIHLDHTGNPRPRKLIRGRGEANGDWFTSRSVQAHYLAELKPSRARVEILNAAAVNRGDEAPVLLSSLEEDLKEVFLIDEKERYWVAEVLPMGRRVRMKESTRKSFRREWWRTNIEEAGLRLGGLADDLAFRAGAVYGVAIDPGVGLLSTHGAIRWNHDHRVVVGPVVPVEGGT